LLLLRLKVKQVLLRLAQRQKPVLLLRATPNLRRKSKWDCSVARSDLGVLSVAALNSTF
jgi:hypothetical protein